MIRPPSVLGLVTAQRCSTGFEPEPRACSRKLTRTWPGPLRYRGQRRLAGEHCLLVPGRPISGKLWRSSCCLQLARLWVLATLGGRWTTRIIVLPDAPLVRSGPYRFVDHPNYWIVALELAVLPLAFGLIWVALAFTLLNAAVLLVRIRAENRALGHA